MVYSSLGDTPQVPQRMGFCHIPASFAGSWNGRTDLFLQHCGWVERRHGSTRWMWGRHTWKTMAWMATARVYRIHTDLLWTEGC